MERWESLLPVWALSRLAQVQNPSAPAVWREKRKRNGRSDDRFAIATDRRLRRLRGGRRRAGRWTYRSPGGGMVMGDRYCISGRSASGLWIRADARGRHGSIRVKAGSSTLEEHFIPLLCRAIAEAERRRSHCQDYQSPLTSSPHQTCNHQTCRHENHPTPLKLSPSGKNGNARICAALWCKPSSR